MLDSTTTPPQPKPIDADAVLSVTLKAAVWNVVIAGLYELPMKVAQPVVQDITRQLFTASEEEPHAPD